MTTKRWEKLDSTTLVTNPWFSIRQDKVTRPDGNEGQYNLLIQADSIHMLVRDQSGGYILIKQYRYPTQMDSWEAPAGLMEADEDIETSAARELLEETGFAAGSVRVIGTFQELAARTNAMGHAVLCEDLSEAQGKNHEEEGIAAQQSFSRDDIMRMIKNGEITDSGTLSTFMIAIAQNHF